MKNETNVRLETICAAWTIIVNIPFTMLNDVNDELVRNENGL